MAHVKYHFPTKARSLTCVELVDNIAKNLGLTVKAPRPEEPGPTAREQEAERWWATASVVRWDLEEPLSAEAVHEALATCENPNEVKKAFHRLCLMLRTVFADYYTHNELLLIVAMGRAWAEAACTQEDVCQDLKNLMQGAPNIEGVLRQVQFA